MRGYGHWIVGAAGPGQPTSATVVEPVALLEASAPVRALVAFLLVLLLGGLLVRRRGPLIDRSIDATTDRPVASIGYGVAAHLVIGFAGFYLTARLGGIAVSGYNAGSVGVIFLLVLAASASVLGFTVVGATLAELWGGGGEWIGVVVGAVVAGIVAAVGPAFAGGGIVWIVVVSMGIGGPVRRWLHASAVEV